MGHLRTEWCFWVCPRQELKTTPALCVVLVYTEIVHDKDTAHKETPRPFSRDSDAWLLAVCYPTRAPLTRNDEIQMASAQTARDPSNEKDTYTQQYARVLPHDPMTSVNLLPKRARRQCNFLSDFLK